MLEGLSFYYHWEKFLLGAFKWKVYQGTLYFSIESFE